MLEDISTTELTDLTADAETAIRAAIVNQFPLYNTVRSVYALQPGTLWQVVLQNVQGGAELLTQSFYVTLVAGTFHVTAATIDATSAAASIAASFGGTAGLSVAKILENMEIGHNVMHGQWDWMRDPKIHSTAWEWDNASPSSQWKHSHNEIHHTFTNVIGRDNDLGYGILRVDEDQRWSPFFLFQPIWHVGNALLFEYSIAAYDLELGGYLAKKNRMSEEEKAKFRADAKEVGAKIKRQATRDYVVHPALSAATGSARTTFTANVVANLVRNVWTNTIIICGHFPPGIETFEKTSIEGETRGEWYLRQMLGSGNITGSKAMHVMSGNLSHQIEHHLFPDMPSNRYAEIAPRIRDLMERHDLAYVTGSLPKQVASVYWKVVELSLPNKVEGQRRRDVVAKSLKKAWRKKSLGRF